MIESSKDNLKKIIQNIVSYSKKANMFKKETEKPEYANDGLFVYFSCQSYTIIKCNRLNDFTFSFIKNESELENSNTFKN